MLVSEKSAAEKRGNAKLARRLSDLKKLAQKVVSFMRESTRKRTLPAALNDGVLEAWLTRDLVEVEGRVRHAVLEKVANFAFVDERTAQSLGAIHPDFKATILTAGVKRTVPWPNMLLLMGLQNALAGEVKAEEVSRVVEIVEAFWDA